MNLELYIKIFIVTFLLILLAVRSRFTTHHKFHLTYLVKYFVIVLVFTPYLFGYLDFASVDLNIYFRVLGLVLVFLGSWMFLSSHKHLGKNWGPKIEKKFKKGRFLVKTGPYKYVRHPIYTASFVILIGIGLLSSNILIFLIPLIFLISFYCYKIPLEEKELLRNFGETYVNYSKTTGGLIPKLK